MRIVIAGGHGQVALALTHLLAEAGHEPVGIIRNPEHEQDVTAAGGRPLLLDLEQTDAVALATHLDGVDAVVFAAGAGPNSGAERKLTVDRDGAILLADAALAAGVSRYVMLSSIGADDFEPESSDVFQVYLRAKSEADAAIRERALEWTIVRPGVLNDGDPTGRVQVGDRVERGEIPRADVAAVLAHVATTPSLAGRQFEVVGGDTPIADALG